MSPIYTSSTVGREIDAESIRALLPQREPFLFLQSARMFDDGHVEGWCSWSDEHVVLEGHFPGLKIVPGVLMTEAAAQVAGLGILMRTGVERVDGVERLGVLNAIRRFTIHRPLFPDEVLHITARFDDEFNGKYAVKVYGTLNGSAEKFFTGDLILSLVGREQLLNARRSV